MRTFIAILWSFAAMAAWAQAYKWVDEDGVVHFSDRPREGAEKVALPQTPRRPAAPPPRAQRQNASGRQPDEAATESGPFRYESLTIGAPLAEETLWNIEGVLNVNLNLQPALQPGHRIRVYFDGEPRMVGRTRFQIDEVYRGVHNIQAEVVDESGTMLIRSMPNRFYVQQNTIVTPPR